jgi:lipoprotein-anchoring transpeptidase ErfK/SrfK
MIRILFAAAMGVAVAFTAVAPAAAATTAEQEILLLKKKKKKLEAELKAKEAKLEAAKAKKKQVRVIRVTTAKKKPVEPKKLARKRDCEGFVECVFGKRDRDRNGVRVKRNGGFQNASFSAGGGMSARKTRKTVDWNETKYPVGSLIVRTPERALYFVTGNGEAIRYSVGVGREGMQWSGNSSIVRKAEWPSWTPPKVMIEREAAKGHIIPPFMEGGPGNPLGARAMYIGGGIFRVHGTNNEDSIGGAVSSGCIRMMNADVIDLYDRVKVGAKIYVYQ